MSSPVRHLVALALAGTFASGCVASEQPEAPGLPVAALLPYTGGLAASGRNLERALRQAADIINENGGVGGEPLQLVFADTHSDLTRGAAAAAELLATPELFGFIGPDEGELAWTLINSIQKVGPLHLVPGITAPPLKDIGRPDTSYRLAPSAAAAGCVTARKMKAAGIDAAGVLLQNDHYSRAFTTALTCEFRAIGGKLTSAASFDATETHFSSQLVQAASGGAKALVLVTYPTVGAGVVQEWAAADNRLPWYFAPSLDNQVFVDNIPVNVVQGQGGVSNLESSSGTTSFRSAFESRWSGEAPTPAAAFYFDAMALMGLAAEAARVETGARPTGTAARKHIGALSSPPGVAVGWDELPRALELVRQGVDIDYQGVSGPIDFGAAMAVKAGAFQTWKVAGGAIEHGASALPDSTCTATECAWLASE